MLFVKLITCHALRCRILALYGFVCVHANVFCATGHVCSEADAAVLQRPHYPSTLQFQHMARLHSTHDILAFYSTFFFCNIYIYFCLNWFISRYCSTLIISTLRTDHWLPPHCVCSKFKYIFWCLILSFIPRIGEKALVCRERLCFLAPMVSKFIEFNIMRGSFI